MAVDAWEERDGEVEAKSAFFVGKHVADRIGKPAVGAFGFHEAERFDFFAKFERLDAKADILRGDGLQGAEFLCDDVEQIFASEIWMIVGRDSIHESGIGVPEVERGDRNILRAAIDGDLFKEFIIAKAGGIFAVGEQ